MNQKQTKVFVGLSGGVDSSVAAARLVEQGYTVVGVFIKVWHPDFMVCNWEQERLDAMRVAAHLGIPFLTCDAEAAYRDDVAHYFIESYRSGKTPNPDVMCNQQVKFGRFLDFAKEHGADYIATGHYAKRVDRADETQMHRGEDVNKDQTYFLWTLSNEQMKYTLFPVGDTPKEHIRKEAAALGLPVSTKKDSQGICFLGHVDIPDFLSHYIDLTPGVVTDTNGEVVGSHVGSLVYTLGQRHGFTVTRPDVNRTAHYVVDRDIEQNIVVVDTSPPKTTHTAALHLEDVVLRHNLAVGDTVEFQTRYRQTPMTAVVDNLTDTTLHLQPTTTIDKPASGQSCVLYQGPLCLGGGIIK